MKGILLILSGPSGVGKDTLVNEWVEANPRVKRVVAYTTRAPREGEVDGTDYHFVDRETFDAMAERGEFLEHKLVYGNGYATPFAELNELLAAGRVALLKIDIQGALEVMDKRPDAVTVFILPPSEQELERRLRSRGTDSPEQIERRIKSVRDEIAVADRYQFRVVNDDIQAAVGRLNFIVEKCTV